MTIDFCMCEVFLFQTCFHFYSEKNFFFFGPHFCHENKKSMIEVRENTFNHTSD